ncbi:MAG: VOC family protein [Pseudomonadales bacterium]|jgi:predicted enzyme related to lactoylglutathione lyase
MSSGARTHRNPIVIHYVLDMDRALAFYKTVFGVSTSTESPGWSMLDFGSFQLALHILSPNEPGERPIPHAGLNLEVDEIEAARSEIEAAGGRMTELREANARVPVRVATFFDPDGNGFELRQNVSV